MSDKKKHLSLPPWPDLRGWSIMGFFALTFCVLAMIYGKPSLLGNASFMQFIQALTTGGILLVGSYLFGGTKSGTENSAKMTDAAISSTPPGAQPVVTVEPPATVTVEEKG